MSLLSPNDDGKRSSPRQTAGKKLAYYGREENKHRGRGQGKKLEIGVNKRSKKSNFGYSSGEDSNSDGKLRKKPRGTTGVGKTGVRGKSIQGKKSGVGVNNCTKESSDSDSSSDEDSKSDGNSKEKPRGTTGGGRTCVGASQ